MTTLTIRRKALAKQEEVPQIPLTKYRRGWRRLLAEHFVARLLCRLATIVFQYEQPERRREITVLAVRIEVTDKLRQRHSRSPLAHSRTHPRDSWLVLRPARTIERLTIRDFMVVPASYVGTIVPRGTIWQATQSNEGM
jgi:hypothetical protein